MAETMFSSVNANSSKAITAINLTFDINYFGGDMHSQELLLV